MNERLTQFYTQERKNLLSVDYFHKKNNSEVIFENVHQPFSEFFH